MVRAKFKCESVSSVDHGIGKVAENVSLRAVYSSDPESENYSWSKYTPAGQLTMNISNPNAFGEFVEGEEYFLDFIAVAKYQELAANPVL